MKRIVLSAVMALSLTPAIASEDLKIDVTLEAKSSYNWRGIAMSDNMPSISAGVSARKDGFFGAYSLSTVKFGGATLRNDFATGYMALVGPAVVGGGVSKTIFTGHRGNLDGHDLSFGELFVFGSAYGFDAELARNIDSSNTPMAALRNGNLYGEIGYTYAFTERCSLGAEVGYVRYDDRSATRDGVTHALINTNYQIDPRMTLSASYQIDGADAYGHQGSENQKFVVSAKYIF